MRATRRVRIGLMIAATLVAATACGGGTGGSGKGGETVTLRVADIYSKQHELYKDGIKPYMDKVEKKSGGRIKFKFYPSEQLAKGSDIPQAVQSGTADIGNVLYLGNRAPLMYVVQLPGMFSDDQVVSASQAFWKFVQKNKTMQQNFKKLSMHPLWCYTVTNYQIMFTSRDVSTLADVHGKQIRASGAVLPYSVEAVGASSVDMDIGEATGAFNRGVIDGIALSVPSVKAYGFYDLIKSAIVNLNMGGFPVCYTINNSTWESLSAKDQNILLSVGNQSVAHVSKALKAQVKEDLAGWRKRGITTNTIDEAQAKKQFSGVEKKWEKKTISSGADAQAIRGGVATWTRLLKKQLGS